MIHQGLSIATICAVLIGSCPAWAWGPEGHAIIADIAEVRLTPAASAAITRLLRKESHTKLDEIASWPDEMRRGQPDTGPWHYVDIPLHARAYDENRDCHFDRNNHRVREKTCVVAKIAEFAAVLADPNEDDASRLEALKFLVHFVGDIHQPLHAADDDDVGGNNVKGIYNDRNTSLHSVWDGDVIEKKYDWKLGRNFSFDHAAVRSAASELYATISTSDRSSWAPPRSIEGIQARASEWANESHALAPGTYRDAPQSAGDEWPDAYQDYAWPVIQVQLEKAGVRLGELLNEALR